MTQTKEQAVALQGPRWRTGLAWSVILLAGSGLLLGSAHYVPFQFASTLFYGGGVLLVLGLVTLVKPVRLLGFRRRAAGVPIVAAGLAAMLAAMLWPAAAVRSDRPRQRIDDFLPEYTFSETHRTVVRAAPARVMAAVRTVRLADMPAAVYLLRLRGLAGGEKTTTETLKRPILELFGQPGSGFVTLDSSRPDEYVGGLVGRPWSSGPPPPVRDGSGFLAFSAPGQVRVAFNIRTRALGDNQTELWSETRIRGTDTRADRIFGCYWRIIYPGSAIIRRVWLDAIAALAENPASALSHYQKEYTWAPRAKREIESDLHPRSIDRPHPGRHPDSFPRPRCGQGAPRLRIPESKEKQNENNSSELRYHQRSLHHFSRGFLATAELAGRPGLHDGGRPHADADLQLLHAAALCLF